MPSDFSKIVRVAAMSKQAKKTSLRGKLRAKRPKKITLSKLQKLLWVECRRLVRQRDRDCFTCDSKDLQGSNAQTGHFIPSSVCGAYLRYDMRNLALQCMPCNIHRGGMGGEFYRRLLVKYGRKYVDQIFEDKQKIVSAREHYETLLEHYKTLD